jgi:hypothetical protein
MLDGNTVVYATVSAFGEVPLELSCRVLIAVDLKQGWSMKIHILGAKTLTTLPSMV